MTRRSYRRNLPQRLCLYAGHRLEHLLVPFGARLLAYRPKMWWIPTAPLSIHPRRRSPARAWTTPIPRPPAALKTVPGIELHPDEQEAAFTEHMVHDWLKLNPGMRGRAAPTSNMWWPLVVTAPRVQRAARRRAAFVRTSKPAPRQAPVEPTELTTMLRLKAAQLGLSAVGVTAYDVKYTFAEYLGLNVGQTVIVGLLEQNYDATQMIPSARSEKAAVTAYAQLEDRMRALAQWIQEQGYAARPEGFVGESLAIAYAVAAGLGQLGLNGQLLTPHAGSRTRLHVMTTDAPLVLDEPVDYGLEGVCNECQICVRRCPPGAIPATRKPSRGVVKAKLNTKRCLPVMSKTSGCSICMKVCPVQRYGLPAVLEEFESTGQILGKDSDDLEGFDWPLDGKHYGPGQKPRITATLLGTPGFEYDQERKVPPGAGDSPSPAVAGDGPPGI